MTQASLSKRIAELESSVGAELFARSSRRAQLIETGARLLPMAAQMLELHEGLRSAARGAGSLAASAASASPERRAPRRCELMARQVGIMLDTGSIAHMLTGATLD